MSANPVVTADWLTERLDDPKVRVIEILSEADDPDYEEGHIPGAICWYWKDALWHKTDREFPTPEEMAGRLGRAGISHDSTVVLYSGRVQFGTYAFWVLKMCGHPDVRMLDGARRRWLAEGRPLTKEIPRHAPVEYRPQAADPSSRVGRDYVRAHLGEPTHLLLDVRSPEEYTGERVKPGPGFDHGAERTGRIPGAVHLFYRNLVNEDDSFKAPEELREILGGAGAGPGKAGEIVVYCRLSHRATLAWFTMKYLLGYENVRIYDGSWTEWGSIVGFPIEK